MTQAIVIDVESTCWETKDDQPRNQTSEIIEIGVAVVDLKSLVILNNDSILVNPQRSKVSKFCTKLTTLTQNQVERGFTFQAACNILKSDYKSYEKTFISWGDYDRNQFDRNCRDYNCRYPFGRRHLNLKNCFSVLHGLDYELGMDAALEHIKLPLKGTHHRGIDDAANIANILIHTLKTFRGI